MSAVMTESAPRHPDGKRRKNGCMKTQRALFWFGSAALGALGGLALGQVAIGEGLYGKLTGASAATSFAEYSSNPLAATVDSIPAPLPCRNCPASYAAAAHARAMRLEAKHDEYQGVEPVEIVYPTESLAQANTTGDTRVFGTETAAEPQAAPGNDQAPSGPARTRAIRRLDHSTLVTLAPPTPNRPRA